MVGTILLTADNQYVVGEENRLPKRPYYDKDLLATLSYGYTVSKKGYNMLPPSIRKGVTITSKEPTFPVTIEEISNLSDLLLVSHSTEINKIGKVFRMDNFELMVKGKWISIYRRKNVMSEM